MVYYDDITKSNIRSLRIRGFTYTEIQEKLDLYIPKSSISYICKGIVLDKKHRERIYQLISDNASNARVKALDTNRKKLENKIQNLRSANENIRDLMKDRRAKLIALSMLYLGEGSKWQGTRAPKLGSSDPLILRLYIDLIKKCYGIKTEKLRCRVQHRADQNSNVLIEYWSQVTGVKKSNFYPSYIDKRTIGKVTKNKNYYGVCTVSCAGTYIQLELAEIAGIISEEMRGIGAVG